MTIVSGDTIVSILERLGKEDNLENWLSRNEKGIYQRFRLIYCPFNQFGFVALVTRSRF